MWAKCWLILPRGIMMMPRLGGAAAIVEARWGVFAKAKLRFDAVEFIITKLRGPYAVQTMLLVQALLEMSLSPSYVVLEDVKSRSIVMQEELQSWNHHALNSRFLFIKSIARKFLGPASLLPDPVYHEIALRGLV
jgi:hypothetical protein